MTLNKEALEKAAVALYGDATPESLEATAAAIEAYLTSLPSAHGELVERVNERSSPSDCGKFRLMLAEDFEALCAAATALRQQKEEGFLWCCHVRGPDDVNGGGRG